MPTDLVVAHVVVLVVISSTPLVLLPNPVDQVRERLWKSLQLSTSHSVSFLHTTSNMRICSLIKRLKEKRTDSNSEESDLDVLATSRKLAAAKNFFAVDLCMTY